MLKPPAQLLAGAPFVSEAAQSSQQQQLPLAPSFFIAACFAQHDLSSPVWTPDLA
jgi:hypothetical protein